MDWLTQNKYKNILIGLLVVLNLLSLSSIWMQTAAMHDTQPAPGDNRPAESTDLLKKSLDFTDAQAARFEHLRADERMQAMQQNDRLAELKTRLADELFSPRPDSSKMYLTAREIGETQSAIEIIRVKHFQSLLAICTPEQKEKLKPIIKQIFQKKPPREDAIGRKQPDRAKDKTELREEKTKGPGSTMPPPDAGTRPAPPSVEEKVKKLSEKITLTTEQMQQINAVLRSIEKKKEGLRQRSNPDEGEIEREKEKLRKEEDESIGKLLRSDQKQEYERMILNRRN